MSFEPTGFQSFSKTHEQHPAHHADALRKESPEQRTVVDQRVVDATKNTFELPASSKTPSPDKFQRRSFSPTTVAKVVQAREVKQESKAPSKNLFEVVDGQGNG